MDVRITTRRAKVNESFRTQADERVRKLARFEPRLHAVDIIVDEDRGRIYIETRAEVPGVPILVATADSDTDRSALDKALQKLSRQLRRRRAKRTDHKAPPAGAIIEE